MNEKAGVGAMMRTIKSLAALALVSLLAACGGGGGCSSGTSPFGSTPGCANGAPEAQKLVLLLSTNNIGNSGSQTVTATATATTAGGQTVIGVPVAFSVDANAIYTPASTTTDSKGTVSAAVAIGSDRSNRIVTVTAISGTLTAAASFAVTGSKLKGTPVPAVVLPGSAGNKVDFTLVDGNDNPMPGQAISIAAGSLGTATGVTGSNGDFSYAYTAPGTPGSLDVTATSGGVSNTQTILVQSTSGSIAPVTTTILSASVTANPSVVSTNTDVTNNRTEIRALFLGANNVRIKNVRVRFDLDGDVNSIGGSLAAASNIVYSDANGIATTAYVPGSLSSPTDGVTIRACYDSVDFVACDPAKQAKTTITVISEPLAVTIGSNEKILTGSSDLTYIRKFVVLVVDSSGRAKGNVEIVPSVDLPYFFKGFYEKLGGVWVHVVRDPLTNVILRAPIGCPNEDVNRNGVLETGEDRNGNNVLEPRKSDVAVSMVGSTKTDASGLAILQIEYPKNVASWVQVKILVSAAGVLGTEGRASWTEVLAVPAEALSANGAPAFVTSPYGFVTTPTARDINGVPLACSDKN